MYKGNASIASKIRDITELRRPTATINVQASTIEDQITVAAVAATAISAATALGKRRRAGYNSLTHVDAVTEKRSSKRVISASNALSLSGNIITASTVVDDKPILKRSSSRRGSKLTASKSTLDDIAEKDIDYNEVDHSNSTMKKMKIEIIRLQDENDELLNEQYTRETVIRMEVSVRIHLSCNIFYDTHL